MDAHTQTRPYSVRVTVRNNLLLEAIKAAGYRSVREFAIREGMSVTGLINLVGLREAPLGASGEFTKMAKKVMEALGACPTDLWTSAQLTMKLARSSACTAVDERALAGIMQLPDEGRVAVDVLEEVERNEVNREVRRLVFDDESVGLRKNESMVLRMRFGVGGGDESTLDQIAEVLDVTPERVRQIEGKAMRKLAAAAWRGHFAGVVDTHDARKPCAGSVDKDEPPAIAAPAQSRSKEPPNMKRLLFNQSGGYCVSTVETGQKDRPYITATMLEHRGTIHYASFVSQSIEDAFRTHKEKCECIMG